MRRQRNRDPYWLQARFPSSCTGCRKAIKKGARIFYWPNAGQARGGRAWCSTCALPIAARFQSELEDERAYNQGRAY